MRGGAFFNGKEGRDDFRKTAPEGGYILPFSRREGLVRMWSSPCRRDGEVEKSALRAVTSLALLERARAWDLYRY